MRASTSDRAHAVATVNAVETAWPAAALGFGLWLAVFLVYLPSLSGGFLWDDYDYVSKNVTLHTADGLRRIWFEPEATPQYYPLVLTTFWVEHHLWDLHPAGYHFTNAALHAGNAVLVWLVLRRLSIPGAWLAAAAFGMHPVHVESVAWVTERKNVLSGFFYLIALLQFIDSFALTSANTAEASTRSWRRAYALGFVLFVAALLSKSVTCSLPAVLVLLLLWKRGRASLRDIGRLTPLFAVGALMALNTAWIEQTHIGIDRAGSAFAWTAAERFLIAGRAIWTSAWTLVWPVNLSFFYPRWQIRTDTWWQWAIAISAFALPAAIAAGRRRVTGPLVALLYFGGTLLPAVGFINVFPMRYSFVADHFQYLASLGLLALFAACWMSLVGSENGAGPLGSSSNTIVSLLRNGISFAVLLCLGILTWQRQSAFHDITALWTDTLKKNPRCMLAAMNLGSIAYDNKDFATAERFFRDGLRIRTDDLETHRYHAMLAQALAAQGRLDEAAAEFNKALARRPYFVAALSELAHVYLRQGRHEAAISLYQKAISRQPYNAVVRMNLGKVFAAQGKLDEAEREYRVALAIDPSSVEAHLPLARLLVQRERWPQAEAEARKAIELAPGNMSATELLVKIRDERQRRDRL